MTLTLFFSIEIEEIQQSNIIEVETSSASPSTNRKGRTFLCPTCGQILSHAGLRRHLRYIHINKRDFACAECGYTCSTKQILRNHVIAKHSKEYPYTCDVCEAGFIIKQRLEHHKKNQHENQHPPRRTSNRQRKTLNTDEKTNTAKKYTKTCTVCLKVLVNSENYRNHMEKHAGIFKGYVCDVCGSVLSSKPGLHAHKKIHTGKKDFVCSVCDRLFMKKYTLDLHMLTHTKEKPHQCSYCGKTFAQISTLSIHMYQHTEKPYKCDVCSKSFSRRNVFNKHRCPKVCSMQ